MPLTLIGPGIIQPGSAVDTSSNNGTGAFQLPAGTTAERPATAAAGSIRFNTTTGLTEIFNGTTWRPIARSVGTLENPASSIEAIRLDNPSAPDGFYYYNIGGTVWGGFTRFNWLESRNWICILKVTARGDMPSGSALWTNNTLQNENDSNITGGSFSKYGGWNNYSFTRLALDMNGTFPALMIFNTSRTMFNAMQNNAGAAFGCGVPTSSTNPGWTTSQGYNSSSFYFSGGPFGAQTGNETIVQQYGINSFANNSTNANPDNAGLASVARAGARVGAPLDEGGYTYNNGSNSGADSGFGFGFCGGNVGRTGSAGYAEWNSSAVVNTLPGRLWVS